ncbi:MAG TPA: undecaprenyldiphospho-muramoylpentapeptide beta-N-acetylglucosaminyltransferase [Fimbriimonadaceae bacterium]|nr:undecaprenyldiphospho-muramoylpentapeptide beta-N-acetylglucosaminyltransferase [Fimbriimonadaceae bacterium]
MKKLVVTGGGTGGHVFPALEVAQAARAAGFDVRYLGSLRGIEGRGCERLELPFEGFSSEPVTSLRKLKGWKALLALLRATGAARRALDRDRPDVLFSTGGYASAPVAMAARRLRIPYVIHEQNTVPGRTNRILAKESFAVATVFRSGAEHFPGSRVVRTGMPIRSALRQSAQGRLGVGQVLREDSPILLVMGGSQGAVALNDACLATALRMASTEVQWLHVAGPSHFDATLQSVAKLGIRSPYEVRAFLEAEELASALFSASLVICRAGAGTLAELAAFRTPAILVPYPSAFGDHQRVNALEFESMGAATLLPQSELQPAALEARIHLWLTESDRRDAAAGALAAWDIPDAIDQVLSLLRAASE